MDNGNCTQVVVVEECKPLVVEKVAVAAEVEADVVQVEVEMVAEAKNIPVEEVEVETLLGEAEEEAEGKNIMVEEVEAETLLVEVEVEVKNIMVEAVMDTSPVVVDSS